MRQRAGSSEAAGQPAQQVDVPASRHGTVLRPRRRERKEEPAGREKTTQAGEESSRSCGRRGNRDRTCCDGISTADCGAGAASVSGEAAARRQPAAGGGPSQEGRAAAAAWRHPSTGGGSFESGGGPSQEGRAAAAAWRHPSTGGGSFESGGTAAAA